MCLAYLGAELSEVAVAQACGTSALGTTLNAAVSGRLGFEGEIHEVADLDWLYDRLACGDPVIVSLASGSSAEGAMRHAVVTCGAEQGDVVYVDPLTGTDKSLAESAFLHRWMLGGEGSLVVSEP
jgi:hypothetical protein